MDCKKEIESRVEWIKKVLKDANAKGVVYGNSGGKDSCLVGALCALATPNVLGVIMPCVSRRNFGEDRDDALAMGKHFGIEQIEVDLSGAKNELLKAFDTHLVGEADSYANKQALINVNPRLRMIALYALGQSRGYLVAGTGNADEAVLGYFTKWGDGAHDFNPIADLKVGEIYELLAYLDAPKHIIQKAPSAGLFEGQTDEDEMGVKYADVDKYLAGEKVDEHTKNVIESAKRRNAHKMRMPLHFGE